MLNLTILRRRAELAIALAFAATTACNTNNDAVTAPTGGTPSFTISPCSAAGTVQLTVAQAVRADCSNGGTTVTLAGNGASYLVAAQMAVDGVANSFVPYRLFSGSTAAASIAARSPSISPSRAPTAFAAAGALPPMRPRLAQLAFDRALRARARQRLQSGAWRAATSRVRATRSASAAVTAAPSVGSARQFRILSNEQSGQFSTVGARLVYAGTNVLVYIDTLAPANGFTATQSQGFGQLFDQTLYPIDTVAFGPPSDIDQNGRVIMLMSPAVNALTPRSTCQTQGYVAGFFEEEDLGGGAADPDSNNGEVFYSIVPDPNGSASCSHTVADVASSVPSTFVHELQHLISFSQHVVVHNGDPEYGWLDEGLSIVAEELGSLYYEQKCPGTACRTDPAQIFPDSAQGFVENFLFDSYQYALLPDTASVTLHSDSDDGFSWRGGDWLLMRWLGDQMGTGFFKKLDQGLSIGVANIQNASGQPFPSLFANFGLALYTDSLPGLARTTAPTANRFLSRNVRQLWSRLFQTSGGAADVPFAFPLQLFAITPDTSTVIMYPGTTSYFRLDTPAGASTVSIQFASPGGTALPAALHPQLVIFRLPAGQ